MTIRPQYLLCHNGEVLLRCDVALSAPFALGETVWIAEIQGDECLGTFRVEKIHRRLAYYRTKSDPPQRLALAGEEIVVELHLLPATEAL